MDTKVIAIAIAAIFIVGAVGVVFINNGNDNGDDSTPDVPTTENCLKIFGNSNGDYVIDQKDKEIVQSVIDGKMKTSELLRVKDVKNNVYCLADANVDGKIDKKDIETIDGILNRTVEKLTVIDSFDYKVSVPLKIDAIICDYFATAEVLQLMGVQDKIIAASHGVCTLKDYYLQGLTNKDDLIDFKMRWEPSAGEMELMKEKNPDLWVMSENYHNPVNDKFTTVLGLDTLTFDFDNVEYSKPIMSILMAGYIFNQVEKANTYVDWYLENWYMFYNATKDLKDSDRPVVAYSGYGGYITDINKKTLRYFPSNTVPYKAVKLAGGYNLFDSYDGNGLLKFPGNPTSNVNGDFEWMADQNYDYLFMHCTKYTGKGDNIAAVPDHGFVVNDSKDVSKNPDNAAFTDKQHWDFTEKKYLEAQKAIGEMEYFKGHVDANNIYLTPGDYMNGASGGLLSTALVATVIHPELFPDLSLQDFQQKYIDMMGFDFDLKQGGVFLVNNN